MTTKILILNTFSGKDWKRFATEELGNITPAGTEIEQVFPENWYTPVEDYYTEALTTPHMLKEAKEAVEKKDYDAAIPNCHCDPAINPLREQLDIPIIGPGEASMALASYLGDKFAFITVSESEPLLRDHAKGMGLESRFSARTAIDFSEKFFKLSREEMVNIILDECKKAVSEDGADVIILGCTGFSYHRLAPDIREALRKEGHDVPVLDSLQTAFHFAKLIKELGLGKPKLPPR